MILSAFEKIYKSSTSFVTPLYVCENVDIGVLVDCWEKNIERCKKIEEKGGSYKSQ